MRGTEDFSYFSSADVEEKMFQILLNGFSGKWSSEYYVLIVSVERN